MTTKELLRTLSNCKTHKRFIEARYGTKLEQPEEIIIDWEERNKLKNQLFKKYVIISGVALMLLNILVFPIFLAHPPLGRGFMLSLPPMFLMCLSWMIGAWWAWDKSSYILMATVFGGVPVRLTLCLCYAFLVLSITGVMFDALIFSMMVYWIIFTVIEIAMIQEFTKKVPMLPESKKCSN